MLRSTAIRRVTSKRRSSHISPELLVVLALTSLLVCCVAYLTKELAPVVPVPVDANRSHDIQNQTSPVGKDPAVPPAQH